MAASEKEAQRIRDAAQTLLAADADFREASWARIRQIAEELSVKKLRGSERRAYARELSAIAAVNLRVAARLNGADDVRALRQIAAEGEELPRDSKASAPVRSQGPKPNRADQVARDSRPFATAGTSATVSQAEKPVEPAAVSPLRRDDGVQMSPEVGETPARDQDKQVGSAESNASGTPATEAAGRSQQDSTPSEDRDEPHHHTEAGETLPSDASEGAQEEEAVQPANPNYDERGRWIGDTAPVNVVQMLNVERVYQSDDEDDKDRYAAAAAQASLYDDPVAVVLPSAEELEAILPTVTEITTINGEELKEEVEAERKEQNRPPQSDTDRTPVAEKGTPGAPGKGGQKPEDPKPAEGEPSISFGVSELSRAERAILADKQRKEAKKARKRAKKEARRKRAEHQRTPETEDATSKRDSVAAAASETAAPAAGATPNREPELKTEPERKPESDPTEPILGKHAGASANHQPAENLNADDADSAAASAASHEAGDYLASGAHAESAHAGHQGHEDEPAISDDADGKADTEANDAPKSEAADQKPSHKRRFKLFGHREDDLPVIPRGKATVAPDDFLVIDKHRAAQAATKAQRSSQRQTERPASSLHGDNEDQSGADS